ncbi:hypothetical protein MN116_000036 [Schistosoma mekongi]|uniref:SWIM-type domain-containing protein n=1 Tax=Schistosoma mekongi TaxID=38744 RepID=A0AAE1ZH55_SCHME|nr:hypothetical protein MN116_000036 [Schistosoma mekongi]
MSVHPVGCTCIFWREYRLPCRHLIALLLQENTQFPIESISASWLMSVNHFVNVAMENYLPQRRNASELTRFQILAPLLEQMPEEQFVAVVHYMQHIVAGLATIQDIGPLPEASTPQYMLSPRRLQTQSETISNSQRQANVNIDELSATPDDVSVISINSEFDARDKNLDEEANGTTLCDVCQHSEPPTTNTEEVTWVVCRCNAMFHLFCAWNPDLSVLGTECSACGAVTHLE